VITAQDAIRAYPELAQLAAIREAGWTFRHLTDDHGQLCGLVGTRHWPGHTDALWIYGSSETRAVRLLADAPGARGGLVWEHCGPLAGYGSRSARAASARQPGAPALILAPAWSVFS
jgi:hypothetical protein